MRNKRGFIGVILVCAVIASMILLMLTIYYLYLRDERGSSYNNPLSSSNLESPLSKQRITPIIPGSDNSSGSSSRLGNTGLNSQKTAEQCLNLNDSYILPDFIAAQALISSQGFVKDVPKSGKISIRFYHFSGNCRTFDKSYFLSNGQIEEKIADSDIEINMHSNYVSKINETNICKIIKEAMDKGDLSQTVNIGTSELVWKYGGMLKYKDCLSGELKSLSPIGLIEKELDILFEKVKSAF